MIKVHSQLNHECDLPYAYQGSQILYHENALWKKIIKRAFKGCNVGFKVWERGGQMSWEGGAISHDNN